VADASEIEQQARDEAERRGWAFERIEGNLVLVRRLIEGDWEARLPGRRARRQDRPGLRRRRGRLGLKR